jgi:hypothetical protein
MPEHLDLDQNAGFEDAATFKIHLGICLEQLWGKTWSGSTSGRRWSLPDPTPLCRSQHLASSPPTAVLGIEEPGTDRTVYFGLPFLASRSNVATTGR